MEKEEKISNVSIKCSHCGEITKIDYSEFKSSMLANHFYRLTCQNDKCGKKTLVSYAFKTIPYEFGKTPEQIFETLTIE